MGVAPRSPLGPVASAAALYFALSTRNFLVQEDILTGVPWRRDAVQHDPALYRYVQGPVSTHTL